MAGGKHLIIGAGSAGLNAAEEIRRISADDVIKIVSAEDFAPYSPTVLPYLLSGKRDESTLAMRQEGYFERLNATFVRGKEAIRIFPETREVLYRDGEREAYDTLLIAAGADSSHPEIKGLDDNRYQGIHTLDDCRRLVQRLQGKADVAILGAGLVAVEVAIALAERGCQVTLIVRSRILRVYFDEDADGIIKNILTANGIRLLYRKGVEAVKRSGGKVEIAFPESAPLAADEFLVCTGVKARTAFLAGSGIRVNEGIVVDRHMQTTIDGIYAAGDIAETPDFFTGEYGMNQIIETAMDGGRVAGSNMAGVPAEYEGWISSNVFHFLGHTSFTAGLAMPAGDGYEIMAEKDAGKARYKKLVFKNNRLVGAMLINIECDPGVLLYLIREKLDVAGAKRQLFERPQETSRRLMLQAEKRQGASIEDHRSKLR
jgi:phenylglyoxylate dehydrogenase epsilon subunit